MNKIVAFLELARYHARGPERPQPGQQPARITYFTVETADGKRCLGLDTSSNQRARDVDASGRTSHQGETDACRES